MNTIYAVYDSEDGLVGFYKDLIHAEKLMDTTPGSYITEIQTDFFGMLDGSW